MLKSEAEELLFDPQTSGGLLMALPEFEAGELVDELRKAGLAAATKVASVVAGDSPGVRVV